MGRWQKWASRGSGAGKFRRRYRGLLCFAFVTHDCGPAGLVVGYFTAAATAAHLKTLRLFSKCAAVFQALREIFQPCVIGDLVGAEFFDDALHVAVATLWRADALVSYNFAHLVRLDTMVEINEINRGEKLAELFLCQPSEVIIR